MKNKRYIIKGIIALLVVLYIIRVYAVNQNNKKTEIHYMQDNQAVITKNLDIQVEKQTLYDTAALAKKYPDVREYYLSMYEMRRFAKEDTKFLVDDEYVLCVEIKITNHSEVKQDIDYTGFHIYAGESYFNGVNLMLFGAINQFSGLSIRPGHSYKFIVPYPLNRDSFNVKKYDNITKQDFSILLKGYPDIRRVRLNHIQRETASEEEKTAWKDLIFYDPDGEEKVECLEDTPNGSLIPLGDTYVQDNLQITVSDCIVTRNVYDAINKIKGWQDLMKTEEDGTQIPQEEGPFSMDLFFRQEDLDQTQKKLLDQTEYTKNGMAILVSLRVQNNSSKDQITVLQPSINNYVGKGFYGMYGFAIGKDITHEPMSAHITVHKGADTEIVFLYKVEDSKEEKREENLWHPMDKELYLDFGAGDNSVDISKGRYGNGKYVQIK